MPKVKSKQAIFLVVLSLAGTILTLIIFNRPSERIDGEDVAQESVTDREPPPATLEPDLRSDPAPPAFPVVAARPARTSESAVSPNQSSPPVIPEEITVHVSSDFSRGELSNLVSGGVLRMGDGRGFGPRGAPPDQKFGVYISPEQEALQHFDEIIAESEAVIPEGSELAFEFRTRGAGGDWSVWQRIEPNQMSRPVPLASPAQAWQYRLTFFAGDPAMSPRVDSIAFATRPAPTH